MRMQLVLLAFLFLVATATASCRGGQPATALSPEKAADYMHAILEANRAVYAEEVVHRLQDVEKVVRADEKFREQKALPLPSQMFRMSAKRVAERTPVRVALISPWAINKANTPRTEAERAGMDAVVATPDAPRRSYETAGGKRYFMALYADRAVSEACVRCHNGHAESPRHDFKVGDVMGGVVVTLPLD